MTDREILKKAFMKTGLTNELAEMAIGGLVGQEYKLRGTLLSHSFAKAFWGEELVCAYDGSEIIGEGKARECKLNKHFQWTAEITSNRWEYHLQNMVLEENPIKYLERYL